MAEISFEKPTRPYAELVAEFGDSPRARLLAQAKYGSEASYVDSQINGQLNGRLNLIFDEPEWNAPATIDPPLPPE